MPEDLVDCKSILIQIIMAPIHNLNQSWPRSSTPYAFTRPHWPYIPFNKRNRWFSRPQNQHDILIQFAPVLVDAWNVCKWSFSCNIYWRFALTRYTSVSKCDDHFLNRAWTSALTLWGEIWRIHVIFFQTLIWHIFLISYNFMVIGPTVTKPFAEKCRSSCTFISKSMHLKVMAVFRQNIQFA